MYNKLHHYFRIKSFLIVILFFVSGQQCLAQYEPFVVEDGIWINRMRTYELDENLIPTYTTAWIDKYCGSSNDTIINGESYKEIDFCTPTSSNYHGALRYDNGQVFFVPKDSLNEYLLYDFTLNVGDTASVIVQDFYGLSPTYNQVEVVINQVETTQVNGTARRVLYTSGAQWIEGIGCTQGLFMEPWLNVSNYFLELMCVSISDTVHYDFGPFAIGVAGTCNLSLSLDELESAKMTLEVNAYPNPTSGSVQFKMENTKEELDVRVLNLLGEELDNRSFSQVNEFTLLLPEISGVYLIEIKTSLGEQSTLKIFKR